jgi:hypothetical protein
VRRYLLDTKLISNVIKPNPMQLLAAMLTASTSHRAVDPRNLDLVAEPADTQNLLSLADG